MDRPQDADWDIRRRRSLIPLFLSLGSILPAYVGAGLCVMFSTAKNTQTLISGMIAVVAVDALGIALAVFALVIAFRMIARKDPASKGRAVASVVLGIASLVYLVTTAFTSLLILILI